MENNYIQDFELFQTVKQALHENYSIEDYTETPSDFVIKSEQFGNHNLNKRKYIMKSDQMKVLKSEKDTLMLKYIALKRFYLESRSNNLRTRLENIIHRINSINEKKEKLAEDDKEYIISKEYVVSNKTSTSTNPVSSADTNVKVSSLSPNQKKKVKRFLFKTYEQCVSQKRTEPTYMSKQDIINHIKEHDKNLLKFLPKKLETMKKDEICKVIFP